MADSRSEAKQLNTSSYIRKWKYLENKEDTSEGHTIGLQRFPLVKCSKRTIRATDYNVFSIF